MCCTVVHEQERANRPKGAHTLKGSVFHALQFVLHQLNRHDKAVIMVRFDFIRSDAHSVPLDLPRERTNWADQEAHIVWDDIIFSITAIRLEKKTLLQSADQRACTEPIELCCTKLRQVAKPACKDVVLKSFFFVRRN